MAKSLMKATAIVTGGAKGFGAGIAKCLKAQGAEVWITGRDQKALTAAAKKLGVHAIRADVTSGADWDKVMAEVLGARGRLDILVNNAGAGGKIAPTVEQTDDEIAQTIGINLTGTLLGCRRAAAIMIKQKSGIIINITSCCMLYAWPGWGIYTAAKAGVGKFSHSLYGELRPHGVRVTNLIPSWGATEFLNAADLKDHPAEVLRKCIQPDEIGTLVVQLCTMPAHLAVPDVTLLPMVQEISPM